MGVFILVISSYVAWLWLWSLYYYFFCERNNFSSTNTITSSNGSVHKEYNSSFSCRTTKLWEQSYSKNKQKTSVKSLVAQLAPLGLSNGEVQGSSPPSSIVSIGWSKTQITNHRSNTQQSSVQNRLLDPFQSEKPIPTVRSNGPTPTHTQTWFCQYESSC